MKIKNTIDKVSLIWDTLSVSTELNPIFMYAPTRKEIHSWPVNIKKDLGEILLRLQQGESVGMPDVRPMPTVAKGASEVRIKDASGIYRVFYIIQSHQGIFIFHGFKKKTQQTPHSEIETAKKRLKLFLEELSNEK
jgi:phage-related protein